MIHPPSQGNLGSAHLFPKFLYISKRLLHLLLSREKPVYTVSYDPVDMEKFGTRSRCFCRIHNRAIPSSSLTMLVEIPIEEADLYEYQRYRWLCVVLYDATRHTTYLFMTSSLGAGKLRSSQCVIINSNCQHSLTLLSM